MKPIFSPWYSSARYHYIATMFPLYTSQVPPLASSRISYIWFQRLSSVKKFEEDFMKPIFSPWYSSARYHYIATMFPLNNSVVPPFRTEPTIPWFERVKGSIWTNLDKLLYQMSWEKSKNNFLVLHFPTYTQHSFFAFEDLCLSGTEKGLPIWVIKTIRE